MKNGCVRKRLSQYGGISSKLNHQMLGKVDMLILIALTAIFFSATPVITFDTIWYHSYLDIFSGLKSITQWDPTRGLPFPLLLYISTRLFGYTNQGITITMYLFYIAAIILVRKIYFLLYPDTPTNRLFAWIILTALLFLNPVFWGYYHLVLTEFVAATLMILVIYIILRTHKSFMEDTTGKAIVKSYVTRSITVLCLVPLAFFLKQMFFVCVILPFLISELIILISHWSWKRVACLFSTTLATFVIIVSLNQAWDKTIDIANARDILGRQTSNELLLGNVFDGGISRYFKSETTKTDAGFIKQVSVYNNGQYLEQFTYMYDRPGIVNAARFWMTCLTRYPRLVCKSYFENYAIICNVYRFSDPRNWDNVDKNINFTSAAENFYIGCMNKANVMGTFVYNQNYNDYLDVPSTNQYIQRTDTNTFLKFIYHNLYIKVANMIYSFVSFFSFAFALFSLGFMLLKRHKFSLHSVNFFSSSIIFLYIVFLSLVGLPLDRYAFPIYVLCAFIFINVFSILCKGIMQMIRKFRKVKTNLC